VCASGCTYAELQSAIDAARPGDTILLRAGETFVGNVILPVKPSSSLWITIRSDAADSQLPGETVRLIPAGKPGANVARASLARIVGSGGPLKSTAVVKTEPGANHYRIMFVEIDGTANVGYETLVEIGHDTTAPEVSHIVFDRVYVHGHPEKGQKRGIALNGAHIDVLNSYVSEIMAVNADSQALAAYHGAGPFRIINNQLEATGENILFGGVDPAVHNLVPSNIQVRRNTITKPLAWRNPVLSAPGWATGWDSGSGGSLSAGAHYFKVVALMETGPVLAHSLASTEVEVWVNGSRSAALTWSAVPGANRYRIYRGTSRGGQSRYLDTPSDSTSYNYSGANEDWGAPESTATYWTIKNLIELKNAQDVTFDGNIIENIWAAGQFGYAIVLTPRNQSGSAPWVRVRDITFTNNIIRHAAGAMQIAGYDNNAASLQTQRIMIRNNLFYDVDPSAWGDYSKTFLIGDAPASITIDHNTIIHNASAVVYAYGAGQISSFVFTNNVTQHRDYGIMASGGRPGNYSIDMYFPSPAIRDNVFLGGRASDYPSPNTFVTQSQWDESFFDAASNDYRLRPGSPFYSAGAGGTVPGADLAQVAAAHASSSASAPVVPEPTPAPVAPVVPEPAPVVPQPAPVVPEPAPAQVVPEPATVYEIVARHSGKCVDVAAKSVHDGGQVLQWSCHGGANQQWRIEAAGDGYSRLIAQHSGKCLDVDGWSVADGVQLQQWACHGGENQQWALQPLGDGYVSLVGRYSGLAVDVNGASGADGAPIIQYSPHGGANQQWVLRPVGGASPQAPPVNTAAAADAVRFLAQPRSGPTPALIAHVGDVGFTRFLDEPFNAAPAGYPTLPLHPTRDAAACPANSACRRENYTLTAPGRAGTRGVARRGIMRPSLQLSFGRVLLYSEATP
jgi:hypothetical protein